MDWIYLDYPAYAPVDSRVVAAMEPWWRERFGNPLSRHGSGAEALRAVNTSRSQVADLLDCQPEEIVFTGTATEALNMAIQGLYFGYHSDHKCRLLISQAEHESVIKTARALESFGARVDFIPVDEWGRITPDVVAKHLTDDTLLVAVTHANSEVGTIQPLEAISKLCLDKGVFMVCDGAASAGILSVSLAKIPVSAYAVSANTFGGPAGVGALFIRNGIQLSPLIHGGKQESHLRAGTHNVPGIVGMGEAARLAKQERTERVAHCSRLRDLLWERLSQTTPELHLTGHPVERLPGHLSILVDYLEGEALLLSMELEAQIVAASGSICGEDESDAYRLLLAMGFSPEHSRGAVRFGLGWETTEEEILTVTGIFPEIVERLRRKSRIWNQRKSDKS